jgi:osmoprotectant transport system permease protein
MIESLAESLRELPAYLGGHMALSMAALGVGLAISLPLGILTSLRPRLAELVLAVAGVVQTVPSLALLALMVPLLGGKIGFVPAFLALTLYSILPILSGTIVGIRGVDPAMTEAALGLGMSPGQMLFRVQLPLAAPVILAGVRTATVLVVGTATLATPVGYTTLGNLIFQGLEMNDQAVIVLGCLLAALLAVALDQLVHLLEHAARSRSRTQAQVAAAGLVLVIAGGLSVPIARLLSPPRNQVVVGSGPFTEQHVLSEVLKDTLEPAGFAVDQRKGMGESIQFLSLRDGKIDCCVNYTGNIWTTLMHRKDVADRVTTLDETTRYLRERYGVVCIGPLGFENAYALAMRRDKAERHGIRTVADLVAHAPGWRIAGDLQFFGRPEWNAVRKGYGLKFREARPMDPTLMYAAVARGAVDVVSAYTSDGRIKALDLVVLEDPRHAFPPYDAVLLLSPQAARRPPCIATLRPLIGTISVDLMREANRRVDVERQTVRRAAENLLRASSGGGGGTGASKHPDPPPQAGRDVGPPPPLARGRRGGAESAHGGVSCIPS